MDNKKTITIIILGLVAMAGILLFLFLPSKSHLANIDFYVYDTNDNFHYEVNERLELLVNDTAAIKGKRLIWEMGNGDTLMRNTDVSYTYRKAGKYLITLKIDGKHSVNKYIKVISGLEHEAIDSIPRINGVSEGYQGEELVFSAEGYGMDTWLWEFGESGTVDAYEQQVVYSYDIPGEYTISLQTNTTKYPVKHRITRCKPRGYGCSLPTQVQATKWPQTEDLYSYPKRETKSWWHSDMMTRTVRLYLAAYSMESQAPVAAVQTKQKV